MKSLKLLFLPVALATLFLNSALSQDAPRPVFPARTAASPPPPRESGLTRFDLDFPGGTPGDLAAAIQNAMGKPLNVIVPDEFVKTKLPALKMKNVNVSELFQSLEQASRKTEIVPSYQFPGATQQVGSSYGFRNSGAAPTDDTIWSFYVDKPNHSKQSPQKVCRFYSLANYLERGATVDDITTAIDTGAKMLGDASGPEIRFHKDTKLLIAVGEPSKLEIVDAVLRALDANKLGQASGSPRPQPAAPAAAEKPRPVEKTQPEEK